jgi:hypothetical protein
MRAGGLAPSIPGTVSQRRGRRQAGVPRLQARYFSDSIRST